MELKYTTVDHHEPIISREVFSYVQFLKELKKEQRSARNSLYTPISGLIFCNYCKRPLHRIIAHPKTPGERAILTCKEHKGVCHINSSLDYELTLKIVERVVSNRLNKEEINETLVSSLHDFERIKAFTSKLDDSNYELKDNQNKLKTLIKEQVSSPIPLDEFNAKYEELAAQIKKSENELNKVRKDEMNYYQSTINESKLQTYLKGEKILNINVVENCIFKMIAMGTKTIKIILNDGKITEQFFNDHYDDFIRVKPIKADFEKGTRDFVYYEIIRPEDVYGNIENN